MIDWLLKRSKFLRSLRVQIRKDLDNNLDLLEKRLNNRIDTILITALDKIKTSESPRSLNKEKSKTSLRQTQENKIIQAFRQTKKQIAKQRIQELQENMSIPSIKIKLMNELGISKASFYNYLKEIDRDTNISKVQISPRSLNKSKLFRL